MDVMTEAMPQVSDGELNMSNTLIVRPEFRSDYLEQLMKVLPQARDLEGCLFLEVGESAEAPGTFILTERWSNGNQYLNEYLSLPFYQEYLTNTEQMYAAPRHVVVLSAIDSD